MLLPSACASLPDVSSLREYLLSTRQKPSIVNTHGALPDAQKQALLDSLATKAGPTDILNKHIAAEEAINGTPLAAGNKVTLLDDGPATMRAMMSAIRGARNHINLETYIFEADEVGCALAGLLIDKAAAGVQVNLIYDSVGTLDTPPEFFARLRKAGIHTLEFNPVNPLKAHGGWDINARDHRKLLVVDGRIAFTGGVNISKVYGKSVILKSRRHPLPQDAKEAAWRDTHMQIEGAAVAEFQKLFLDTWRRKAGHPLTGAEYFPPLHAQGNALVRALGSTPERAGDTIYKTYISALSNADHYVCI
ncbi:MAG TPA: phospholipase D-like domain-containing protein [Noviherbaspirillum sp.]